MSRRTILFAGLGALGVGVLAARARRDHATAGTTPDAFPLVRTDDEWRQVLTPAQYGVLRAQGTERAFSSPLNQEKRPGVFKCAGCGQSAYLSQHKFDSGTGWPSFWTVIDGAVGTSEDRSIFMARTEVHCSNCGSHHGHVFSDGPPPTGLRYCINGVALTFEAA